MSGVVAQNVGGRSGLVKAVAAGGGEWTLIQTQTASASGDISFTSGLDSTYDAYCFKLINIHPETDATSFGFNLSIDGGSNYNVTKTTTMFRTQHYESGTSGVITYITGNDLAQSTGIQYLHQDSGMGADNDQCLAGMLYLFSPSSTTFVKHFMSTTINVNAGDRCREAFVAGYGNTTSAVDAIQFKMASGDIDSGTFSLYGIG